MKKFYLLLSLAAIFAIASCKNKGLEKLPSGLQVHFYRSGTQKLMKEGDLGLFDFVMKNERDSVVGKFTRNISLKKHLKYTDLMDVIAMMNEGDSITALMSVDSIIKYEGQSLQGLKPSEKSKIHLYLKHILTPAEKEAETNRMRQAQKESQEKMVKAFKEQYAKDSIAIVDYTKKNKITDYKKSPDGVICKITQAGDGKVPAKGDTIYANYTGMLLDGEIFDKSKDAPLKFIIGAGQVIPGWDIGFTFLSKGSKAKLIVPSTLAYGPDAMGTIPANSVLIFDVEVVDIKAGKGVPAMRMK